MPRRQITDSTIDAGELPDLTPQQQEFVRAILEGKTASDAYRAAYDTSNWANKSIWVEASRLANHPGVVLWLAAARKACLGSAVVTLDDHQRQLARLREIALASGNLGAAVAAEQTRGKVAGHHVERVMEVPADPVETLKQIGKTQPDLAAQLATLHGIEWKADEGATKH
jgi:phage terminase small subunit